MAEYIDKKAVLGELDRVYNLSDFPAEFYNGYQFAESIVRNFKKADVSEERRGKLYSAHEVAEILAEAIGDKCACNVNGNDEWLPEKCELLDACPNPVGVACWEQWLKWKDGGAENA